MQNKITSKLLKESPESIKDSLYEYMSQSHTALQYLSEDELNNISLKIKDFFKLNNTPINLNYQDIFNYLWTAEKKSEETDLFDFCLNNGLYDEDKYEYRQWLKKLPDLDERTTEELSLINKTQYHIDEALRAEPCLIGYNDIYSPTDLQVEKLLKNSFITLIMIDHLTPHFLQCGLDKVFVTYCDEKREYMPLTRQLTMLIRRVVEKGFNPDGFKFVFNKEIHKKYYQDNIDADFIYKNLF